MIQFWIARTIVFLSLEFRNSFTKISVCMNENLFKKKLNRLDKKEITL